MYAPPTLTWSDAEIPGGAPATSSLSGPELRALDGVLALVEREQHSATELRVLLKLIERRDATVAEIAETLGTRLAAVRPAARQLARRGLVHSRHLERSEQMLLAITPTGLEVLIALFSAGRTARGCVAIKEAEA